MGRKGSRWALVGLTVLAWGLRVGLVWRTPLHADEALYGYWGLLIRRGWDPWLVGVTVYKPPLIPYLLAVSHFLLGRNPMALRFWSLAAGVLLVPLTARLARLLYGGTADGTVSALAAALFPGAIVLSGAGFTDLWMVMLGTAASVAVVSDRYVGAGFLAALSLATKQSGLFFLPWTVVVGIVGLRAQDPARPRRCWARFALGYVGVVIAVLVWDGVRVAQGATGFWATGMVGYGGLRMIWPQELRVRLLEWLDALRQLLGSWGLTVGLAVGMGLLVARALTVASRTRDALVDLLIVVASLGLLLVHWLWAFLVRVRYLLPLVPLLGVVVGRLWTWARSVEPFTRGPWARWALMLLLILGLCWPLLHQDVGSAAGIDDAGQYAGVEELAAALRELGDAAPASSEIVLYHHWLGWHYAYLLFDAPIHRAYWPTPAWLAEDIRVFGSSGERYIAFPAWESTAHVSRALEDIGYGLRPCLTVTRPDGTLAFTLYRILLEESG